jgi:hypothetical protein
VEHLFFYSVIGLAVLALGLALAKLPGSVRLRSRPEELADRAQARRKRDERKHAGDADRLPQHKMIIQRELKQVPTPWGWPGSEMRHDGGEDAGLHGLDLRHDSSSLKRWIDHLFADKRTVEDDQYRSRREAALRAMVEDRFGRTPQATEVKFQKVKPPRLRDPDRSYDQMDNFPSGRTEAIVTKLSSQPSSAASKIDQKQAPLRKTVGLGDIRKPWGW